MSNNLDRWLNLEIYVQASHPELLTGLDEWLHLGLINESQVKSLARNHLTCSIPAVKLTQPNTETNIVVPSLPTATKVKTQSKPNIISQIWQAFLDELSIRWLLFLGIFLIVVSSGVLAATQWDNFPVAVQYLILWIYTLSFWGIGVWSGKQENLKLTSQTLTSIAILLVPINFWAMSSFSLTNSISGWFAVVIASVTLTGITYLEYIPKQTKIPLRFLLLFLLLSYLHLAWVVNSFAVLAVYIGLIAVAITNYWLVLRQPRKYKLSNLLFLLSTWSLLLIRAFLIDNYPQGIGLLLGICGWLLAIVYLTKYQIILKTIATRKYGDSFKILFTSKIWQQISIILLLVAWCVSLVELLFWQTTVISLLAVHVFSQRLQIYWRKRDLTAIFLLGLQTLLIAKELIPAQLRTKAVNLSTEISQTEYFPESVFSVTLFPYLILFVIVATWLYRREKPQLALYTEWLTLIFGVILTGLSLTNPTWRTLNLFFSSLTLGYVAYIRKPVRIPLIYITHSLGLLTIYNSILVVLPNLGYIAWGIILLSSAIAEWTVLILANSHRKTINQNSQYERTWYRSSWYFGLVLASASYTCFKTAINISAVNINGAATADWRWGLIWLLTPLMLTAVAKYTRSIRQRRLAVSLSCGALVLAQLLTIPQSETRLIGLAVATGLMLANVYYLRRIIVAEIHLGFILSLITALLWNLITGWNWLIVGAIAVISLIQTRQYLLNLLSSPRMSYISQRVATGILGVGAEANNFKLIRKYAQATDFWTKTITTIELVLLSVDYLHFAASNQLAIADWQYLLTALLISVAILLRYGKQLNMLALFTTIWAIELVVFGAIVLAGGGGMAIAVTNIILGLLSCWTIDSSNNYSRIRLPNSAKIPLIYALLGTLWRLPYFTAYTGLLTLIVAITGIIVSQNWHRTNKTLNHISLAAISLGIYELVIYQMSQSSGGSVADGFTILALVAAAIAFTYRIAAWWQKRVSEHHDMVAVDGETGRWGDRENSVLPSRKRILNFSLKEIILVAHIHWAIASMLKIIAAGMAIEYSTPRLTSLSIAVSFFLGVYALIQGRDTVTTEARTTQANDWWVYVGLVEIAATLVYCRLIISKLSLFDPWRVVFTIAIALIIYQIPWQNFGWKATPWQRTALVIPALMALVTAETISYFSLFVTAAFYLRIAYHQRNIRWSYISLGFIDWGITRLVWQYNTEAIWLAAIISLSIFYIAQFDPDLKQNRQYRHYLRLSGSTFLCIVALFYQDTGIIPSVISLVMILVGLGLRIRAFLFAGTIAFTITVIYQLVILVFTYSFLKWIIGIITGILAIAAAANFETKRDRLTNQLQSYTNRLKQWE